MDVDYNIFRDCDSDNTTANTNRSNSVYIFGYGSLIWNPGFEYAECLTGYVRGYSRKFWQGNVTHRGTVENPGRVVTLVEDKTSITWGCAFKVTGDYALQYLEQRECTLGGYEIKHTKFYPRVASESSGITGEAFLVVLYIATANPFNNYWLGDDNSDVIAQQIVNASGNSGHNIEYLLRLAMFMREEIPHAEDEHLFTLEKLVREEMIRRKICIISVMGQQPARVQRDHHETLNRNVTFAHSSRVPEKKLRCLNI
ncbi:glutathione-specific gamma-glutamylcyclotransferase 1 [Chironomus tepperi]|uniref:glutathione-specific gamma-glutamylcyclotransferase 1 n=1 Tax=Chironomus tepperi TaxID=113505 RepID=UPI00391EE7F8